MRRGAQHPTTTIAQRGGCAREAALRVAYPGFSVRRRPSPMRHSIAFGLSPNDKPGYGIPWVPYIRFHPLVLNHLGQNFLERNDYSPFSGSALR